MYCINLNVGGRTTVISFQENTITKRACLIRTWLGSARSSRISVMVDQENIFLHIHVNTVYK